MLTQTLQEYVDQYTEALHDYLNDAGETALQDGYILGRRAIVEGLGILDLARVYQCALSNALQESPTPDANSRIATLASNLFAESLSPYEMTHRGFREAVTTLSARTIELSQVKPSFIDSDNKDHLDNLGVFAGSVQLAQERERQNLTQTLQKKKTRGAVLIGQSPAIQEIRDMIALAADTNAPVLITGESGTGKEIVARLIHSESVRSDKPFIALNCAALPRDVIENELFGHEKGAYTGATSSHSGCFELADTGVLFLDEIAEMNPDTQAKMLRAVELNSFRRLGAGREEITVDIRVIAATNKNIQEALKSGAFREDLYYRLGVIEIAIPPLRDRREDIPLLAGQFLQEFQEKYQAIRQWFSDEFLEMMCSFDWPGNVRELRNVIERAVILCPDEVIEPHHMPSRIKQFITASSRINIPLGSSTQDAERELILKTLASVNNNKSKAAKILGLSRNTLHYKLRGLHEG